MSKIQVTLNIDDAQILQESEQSQLEAAINRELGWLHDSGMSVEGWSFLDREPEKIPLESFYYTFGTSPSFPFQKGWVEVQAQDRYQADHLFRNKYPDRTPGILNCSFKYNKEEFERVFEQHIKKNPDWAICHDTIIQPEPRDVQKAMYEELEKNLKDNEYRAEFYTMMDEDIAEAVRDDDDKPGHKYWQMVDSYISGTDETRRIIDEAVCAITGRNLSTILRNTKDMMDEFQPAADPARPSLTQIMSAAEDRKAETKSTSKESKEHDR